MVVSFSRLRVAILTCLLAAGLAVGAKAGVGLPWPVLAASGGLETNSDRLNETRRLLPASFVVYDSKRYALLSDASPSWSRRQLALLERTHHQFQRLCRQLGLKPEPLRHKLVAVVFDSRIDYQRFAMKHDSVSNPALSGYYSPRHDRVIFYNSKSNPSVAKARGHIDDMKSEMHDIKQKASEARRMGLHDEAGSLRDIHAKYRQHLSQQRKRIDTFSRQTGIATIVHEAIHQLMFHTKVQTAKVQYPLWICEGLATAFETDDTDAAFGPRFEYAPRREEFHEFLRHDHLLPLRDLITFTSLDGVDERVTPIVYQQSYALVTWMCRFRKSELLHYMTTMQNRKPGRPSGTEHLELFRQSFGDIARLEQAWLRHEQSLLSESPRR